MRCRTSLLKALEEIDLGEKATAFRAEVREWLAANWNKPVYTEAQLAIPLNERLADREFSRTLGTKGWLGVSWPRQYGGQQRSASRNRSSTG